MRGEGDDEDDLSHPSQLEIFPSSDLGGGKGGQERDLK